MATKPPTGNCYISYKLNIILYIELIYSNIVSTVMYSRSRRMDINDMNCKSDRYGTNSRLYKHCDFLFFSWP